jgi:hypothetical protein
MVGFRFCDIACKDFPNSSFEVQCMFACKVDGAHCCKEEDTCLVALHIWQDATAVHNWGSLILGAI